ncbi:aa3-type cytochrome c oxidase subunit IV [Allosediminivita pacifica]|uniref:Aa3 type cytochrome c oxidase subunit IV n=1 Tax=Allosediminivita pacifica TaxID=1267769 RepID=A0A2T6B3U1_9RHOB|nr:aa3-type cytochrome c oxidase subunit IV [Allosediminivita pacifica]PTX50693.1 aa3 type cytochrome c oxidase subunit IV [Allosediminivita pacifica]GGB00441.1 hypothetical protein GCM10011324_08390 [Allosediminivita pacifica]
MAEHKHGSMDITEQEKTFEGFVKMTIRTCIVILLVVLFLAIFRV